MAVVRTVNKVCASVAAVATMAAVVVVVDY